MSTLEELLESVRNLVDVARLYPSSRELSIAITNLQQAGLWVKERIEIERMIKNG